MASKYSFCPCSSSPRDSRSAAVASFDGGSIVRRSGGFTCTGSACDICAKETVARQTQEARTATGTRPFGQSAIGHPQVNLFWHSSSHPNQAFRSRKGRSESREPEARLQCCSLSGGLDTGAELLSSLNIPAILPKKPFFLLGSFAFGSCPGWAGITGFDSPPNILVRKPLMPCWDSQVSRGSVPSTNADV